MPQDWQNARGMAKCQEGIVLADSTWCRFYLVHVFLCSIPSFVLPACAALTQEKLGKLLFLSPCFCRFPQRDAQYGLVPKEQTRSQVSSFRSWFRKDRTHAHTRTMQTSHFSRGMHSEQQ